MASDGDNANGRESEGSLIKPPLQPPEKNPLGDRLDVEVNFDLWLQTEDEGEGQGAIMEGHDPSTHTLPPSLQLPEISKDSINEGSESSKTLSPRSATGGSFCPRSTPAAQEHGETMTTATVDANNNTSTSTPLSFEDWRFLRPPRIVSMAEFIENEELYAREHAEFNDQLNQLRANRANLGENPRREWQPETPEDMERYLEFADAMAMHPYYLSGHNLDESEQTINASYQPSITDFQNQTPFGDGLYDSPTANNSSSDLEHLLSDTYNSSELDETFDQDSPTFLKQCRRKRISGPMDVATLEHGTSVMQQTGAPTLPSHSQLSLPVVTSAGSYVSENVYSPSLESTIILPRHSQPSSQENFWLDHQVAREEERDTAKGFNSPEVLRYDPLGDLTPQNEKHEAARCLRAAELIFQQDVMGQNDWYDHEMVGVYHYIPKSETDKWHDDSNFIITDEEFEELIEGMDKGKEECVELPEHSVNRLVHDVTMEDSFTTYSKDDSLKAEKETESLSKQETVRDQVLDQAVMQPQHFLEKETNCERAINLPTSQTESSTGKETGLKKFHPLTPTGEPKRKVARLNTTPERNLSVVERLGSEESADSFKTACGSPQIIEKTSDDVPLPIPSFHTERPGTPTHRLSRSSKGRKARYVSQEKTTKNVFAAVEERLEQLDGRSSKSSPTGSGSFGGTPKPRPLQPSLLEAYPTHGSQYYAGNVPGSLGTPTPPGGRHSRRASFVPAPQLNQSFPPQPAAPQPGPTSGTFYSNVDACDQQPQQFCGIKQPDSIDGYHLNVWNNRVGYREQMSCSQPNSYRGQGHSFQLATNNPMQHARQGSARGYMEYHQTYTGYMQMHPGQLYASNRSSDSTISAASPVNNSQGFSRQGYQLETPSQNGKLWKQISSCGGLSTSPPVNTSTTKPNWDPRTPRTFDTTAIKFNLPPSASKSTTREKAVIAFREHKECAYAFKVLEDAAKASPEKKIMFTETFEDKPTTIILSAPAGNNIRGWVKNLLPYAHVDVSMT